MATVGLLDTISSPLVRRDGALDALSSTNGGLLDAGLSAPKGVLLGLSAPAAPQMPLGLLDRQGAQERFRASEIDQQNAPAGAFALDYSNGMDSQSDAYAPDPTLLPGGPAYRNYLERINVPVKPSAKDVIPLADDRIAANVESFFDEARAHGINLQLQDGFRTNGLQARQTGNQYGGAPVNASLHEAGFAFDVNWRDLSQAQRKLVLDIAARHKFQWGGTFKHPDPVHFYTTPLESRSTAIKQAQDGFWGE